MSSILIVDDEKDIRDLIADALEDEGYTTTVAKNSVEALQLINNSAPKVILLDIWLEGSSIDGIALLKHIKQRYSYVPVIMISGHANIKTAVEAIKLGAYDFLEKPFKIERLLLTINRAIEASTLSYENDSYRKSDVKAVELIGSSRSIKNTVKICKDLADSNTRTLLVGEHGSGKEIFARYMHSQSERNKKPFVLLTASNLNQHSFEEALLGKEKDGVIIKLGALEKAEGGTLFIDEIGRIPHSAQAGLLQILQENRFTRINGSKEIEYHVRIISSSCIQPKQLIEEGFHRTLLERLSTAVINIPSLRERSEDIELLINNFAKKLAIDLGKAQLNISSEALSILSSYSWPGNVRQLKNVVEWLLIAHEDGEQITIDMLPQNLLSDISQLYNSFANLNNYALLDKKLKDARDDFEKEYIIAQLRKFSGNISKTAEFIGMDRTALHRKIKQLDLHMDQVI